MLAAQHQLELELVETLVDLVLGVAQVVFDRARVVRAELEQDPPVVDETGQLVDRVDDLEAHLLLGDDDLGPFGLVPEARLGHLVLDVG